MFKFQISNDPCSRCGADATQRIAGQFVGVSGFGLTTTGKVDNVEAALEVEPLVCLQCGLIQFQVSREQVRAAHDLK